MITFILSLIAVIVSGATFRIRGIGVFGSAHLSRLTWAVPTALCLFLATRDWLSLAMIPTMFVGVLMGWGSYMDMGRMPLKDNESIRQLVSAIAKMLGDPPDGSEKYDLIGMTVRGFLLGLPTTVVFSIIGYHAALFMLGTGVMGLIYNAAWRNARHLVTRYEHMDEPTEFAELGMGLVFGALAVVVLLVGRS